MKKRRKNISSSRRRTEQQQRWRRNLSKWLWAMQNQQYRQIDAAELKMAYASAWSIENMEGHGAANRGVEYIGSTCDGDRITDYYKDVCGGYWYRKRAIVNGGIVSMEQKIFGKRIKKYKRKG